MRLRRHFAMLVLLMIGVLCYSQNNRYILSGHIIDSDGGGLPGANVAITNDSADTVMRASSDAEGNFSLQRVPEGKYHVTITYLGFDDYSKDVYIGSNVSLGKIKLQESSRMLNEVTVMGRFTDVKPSGETVVRVAGNPLAKGQSFINFLRNVRNLDVTDKSIKVQGRDNTLFYIDDKEASFEQLKALSPSMISRVEIVPHADAAYGVNATGGVVKVYLREEGGLLGSLSFYGEADKYGYVDGSPMVNLLYSKGKFTVSNMLRGMPYSHYVSKNDQDNGEGQAHTVTDGLNRGRLFADDLSLRYAFNKTDRIDVYGSVNLLKEKSTTNSTTGTDNLLLGNNLRSNSYSAGIQLRKGFGGNGSYLQLISEYSKNKDNNDADYTYNGEADPVGLRTDMDNFNIRPRLYWNFKENMTLSAGLGFYYLIDRHKDDGTQKFNYIADGDYHSLGRDYDAWVQYSARLSDRLFIRAGLSYHGTESVYKNFLDPSSNTSIYEDGIYPTLFGQWTFNQKKLHYIALGLRHYYSLPNYNYRIPTMIWQGENLYSIGNPDLRKENYDDIEIFYSLNKAWSVSYDFNYGDNMVNVIMRRDAGREGVFYTSPENTGNRQRHTVMVGYADRITKFWYTNTKVYGVYVNENAGQNGYDCALARFNSYNDFSVCDNFGITLNLYAATRSRNASYISNARYSVDAGARLSLFKGKADVSLVWANMLYNRGSIKVEGNDFTYMRRDLNPDSRVQLSVSWNFSAGRKIKNENLPTVSGSSRETPTF